MVVPTGKVLPGVCDLVQTRFPEAVQLSVAVGSVQLTTALHVVAPAPVPTEILVGHPLITGRTRSFMVTVNVQVALTFPAPSVAV